MAKLTIESEIDLNLIGSLTFTLTETGGGGATGSVSLTSATGPYYWTRDGSSFIDDISGVSTDDLTPLTDALEAALNAVGNATYTVTFSESTSKVTISASGGSVTAFAISSMNAAAKLVYGFPSDVSGALTYTATNKAYYFIRSDFDVLSGKVMPYEIDDDLVTDQVAEDGTRYPIAKPGAALAMMATVPAEAREKVFTSWAPSTAPWTWQKFFEYHRGGPSYAITYEDGSIDRTYFVRNQARGAAFVPQQSDSKYWQLFDIPLQTVLLAEADNNSAPPAFVPTDLGSSLTGWYKDAGLVGSPVTTWNDSSGNGRNFTASSTPASSTLGGYTCASLDGVNDFFQAVPSVPLSDIISSAYHVFVVCQPSVDFDATSGVSLNTIIGDQSGYWSVGGWIPAASNRFSHYNWDGSSKNADVAYTSGAIACFESARSGSNIYGRVHLAASSSSIASVASGATSVTTGNMAIGVDWGGTKFFAGKIAEIICVNRALTSTEQESMRAYLLARFALNNPVTNLY